MQTKQAEWATQIRAIPENFRQALASKSEEALRHRPAEGEWSAIEVIGHFVDKMGAWQGRVELLSAEHEPEFPGYDQDAYVRENNYQNADLQALFDQLIAACESFAKVVETLPDAALARQGRHLEYGTVMTVSQCIEAPLDSVPGHLKQFNEALLAQ